MIPLGVLFGLSFDTASEVGLLALTAGAAAGDFPIGAVLCLPLLFAAGMTAMDTTDAVLMCRAYRWFARNPARRIVYDIATTALTVALALFVGTVELLEVARSAAASSVPFLGTADLAWLGYAGTALFAMLWGAAVVHARVRRADAHGTVHAHPHVHADGVVHTHHHLH